MNGPDASSVAFKLATDQIKQEDLDREVEEIKARLREHKPFWHTLFPWVITIKRRS
jgi:hypothetical protein